MYKDKVKQRAANRLRQQRFKAKNSVQPELSHKQDKKG